MLRRPLVLTLNTAELFHLYIGGGGMGSCTLFYFMFSRLVLSTSLLRHLARLPHFSFANTFLMLNFLFSSRKKIADLQRQVNALQAELVQARMKNASYRGKIGSLSRKLKEANA